MENSICSKMTCHYGLGFIAQQIWFDAHVYHFHAGAGRIRHSLVQGFSEAALGCNVW